MLIYRCKSFSGYFQFQKGKLQYINEKSEDFFEIDAVLIQALQIQEIRDDKSMSQLNIIGNFQIIKSIQLPTKFAKDVKYWIYLNLHFLGKKDSQNCHQDVQPLELVRYKKSQKIRNFCFILICIVFASSLSRSISYSYQLNQLKTEAKYIKLTDLLNESKKLIENGEFNEGIHYLLLVSSSKPSVNVRSLLDDAYLIRGKYFLSTNNIPQAKLDFKKIKNLKKETEPLLALIKEKESDLWLKFSDISDLILFSWDTFKSNLDHGKNKLRTDEMKRTWNSFQRKFDYTSNYNPVWQYVKDLFIATIY